MYKVWFFCLLCSSRTLGTRVRRLAGKREGQHPLEKAPDSVDERSRVLELQVITTIHVKLVRYLMIFFLNWFSFSWHELGVYDLPAAIAYITQLKGDTLFYIGHSMAGSTISVMASERPEMMSRLRAVVTLAPATFVHHVKAPVKLLVPFWRYILVSVYTILFSFFFIDSSTICFFNFRGCPISGICTNSFLAARFSIILQNTCASRSCLGTFCAATRYF